jgi:hypothetical protein
MTNVIATPVQTTPVHTFAIYSAVKKWWRRRWQRFIMNDFYEFKEDFLARYKHRSGQASN